MKAETARDAVCLAIDTPHRSTIQQLINDTRECVGMFKLGLTAMQGVGVDVIRQLDRQSRPLFLDAKLHDIPAQVAGAVEAMRGLDPTYVTVHASGGEEMIRAAVKATQEEFTILGVTVLTSLDDELLDSIGLRGPVLDAVIRLADLAIQAGVQGLVCSPNEVGALRNRFGSRDEGGPLLVVPGIRPSGGETHDQRRTMSPCEALAAGADVLVVGRPITGAPDPGAAARALLDEVSA